MIGQAAQRRANVAVKDWRRARMTLMKIIARPSARA